MNKIDSFEDVMVFCERAIREDMLVLAEVDAVNWYLSTNPIEAARVAKTPIYNKFLLQFKVRLAEPRRNQPCLKKANDTPK